MCSAEYSSDLKNGSIFRLKQVLCFEDFYKYYGEDIVYIIAFGVIELVT